jgi:hypothetical protein
MSYAINVPSVKYLSKNSILTFISKLSIKQKKAREHSLEQNEFYNLITKTYTIQIYTY